MSIIVLIINPKNVFLHLGSIFLRYSCRHQLPEVFGLHLAVGVLGHEPSEGVPHLLGGHAAGADQSQHVLLPENWLAIL